MSRYARFRKDTTHADVRQAFERCGCPCVELDSVIDLAVFEPTTRRWYLADAKTPSKKGGVSLTAAQQKLAEQGLPICYVKSAEEAVALVRAWRRGA